LPQATECRLAEIVLREWAPRLATLAQLWAYKDYKKEYRQKLPVSVAKALYDDMLGRALNPFQQSILAKIDQAFINL